jgi:hemoglobin
VIKRRPIHPSITQRHIDTLVDTFYDAVWADARLGPIFKSRIADRPAHLATMKRFWSAVLMHTGAYKGKPVPAHVKLTEVVESDFPRWLDHFGRCADRVFEPEAAVLVRAAARRIAESLWLAMSGDPFAPPPAWR